MISHYASVLKEFSENLLVNSTTAAAMKSVIITWINNKRHQCILYCAQTYNKQEKITAPQSIGVSAHLSS